MRSGLSQTQLGLLGLAESGVWLSPPGSPWRPGEDGLSPG